MAAPIVAAGIAAGSALLGQGAQMMATGKMNRKNRAFAEKMMHRQRDWALADYAMQNEYNSPQAQMARLKAAGLNPNLVYGSGATAEGGVVRSTDTAKYAGETPSFDALKGAGGQGIAAYQNAQSMALQNNLTKQQITIAEREAQLKEIQAQALQLGILDKRFDLDLKSELRPYSAQLKKKQVETLDQNIMESLTRMSESSWRQNTGSTRLSMDQQRLGMDKERLISDMSTAELQRTIMRLSATKSQAETEQIRTNINNLIKTGRMQDMLNSLQRRLGESNLTTSDPAFYKLMQRITDQLSQDIRGKNFWENIK